MKNWIDEMLVLMSADEPSEQEIARAVERAIIALGFEHFFFAYRPILPLSKARMQWVHNYPREWCQHNIKQGYMQKDPRVIRARQSGHPVVWTDELFRDIPELRRDQQAFGMRHGWTQSINDGLNDIGYLSISRAHVPLTMAELQSKQKDVQRLALLCHGLLFRQWRDRFIAEIPQLTAREAEVMRWTADGKSAQEIAEILSVSKNTVDFHIKNFVQKLGAPNKTAAVTHAAVLGLLH